MKSPPAIRVPRLCQSDLTEARELLGCESPRPVGVVLSAYGYSEMQGANFPCAVAVDVTAPRETCTWFYLPANFQPFSHLIK